MKILERRDFPRLASLYLGSPSGDPERAVEFVDTLEPGVPKERKWVMMVSTQLGCAVGCRMCDAGALGYRGNLTAEEMLAQVRYILEQNPALDAARHPKLKIHFARMGEPALNPEVTRALCLLREALPYPGILPSLSSVAPNAPVAARFFSELAEIKDRHYGGGRFQLQFSLHADDDTGRRAVVPIRTWTLEAIARYGEGFVRPGDRKVTLNFALAPDEGLVAPRLGALFDPAKFLIKITPVNPTQAARESGACHPWEDAPAELKACSEELRARGFEVILSPSLPEEIEAETSCGQLWSSSFKERAMTALQSRRKEASCYLRPEALETRAAAWDRELDRGRRLKRPFTPGKAGLLIVDMQQFFLHPGSPAYLPQSRAILPKLVALARAFRAAGRPVLFARHAHEDPERDGGLMTSYWSKVCLEGTPHALLSPLLEAREEETFRKCRYSAFTHPGLEPALKGLGVERLVVGGIAANLCVESTVRDAFDLGFETFLPLDGVAAHTEELHLGSLRSLAQGFSTVLWTRDILNSLEAAGRCVA